MSGLLRLQLAQGTEKGHRHHYGGVLVVARETNGWVRQVVDDSITALSKSDLLDEAHMNYM